MMRFYEAQVGNLVREGAQSAGIAEQFAIKLKAAEAKIAELTAPKDNVTPISKGDAA